MSALTASSPSTDRRAPRAWPWFIAVASAGLLLFLYPPFRVVSRPAGGVPVVPAAAFEPVAYAGQFWSARLLPAAAQAPAAGPLLAAVSRDPVAAARAQAHRVGLGSAAYYFARGSGRVTVVERSRLLVEVEGVVVALRTGPVFGNVVRDGCGLLEVNQVPGLTEFNALSAELNRLVEERVQPALRAATVGATVRFAGAAEAPESVPAAGSPVLTFIPVQAEVVP